ncbi:MAG: YitT family protein, partial [Alistipes sp.]|nr:YitT family protein [Alistipes sp.]
DLRLACIAGAGLSGVGMGSVVRKQATTGGTDIVGMLLQKFAGIKFSTGIFLADGFVVLSGLVVIGFGLGLDEAASNGWMLTLYSLITIYISSRVVAYMLDGASYDKLLFIISDHHADLKRFIIEDLDRSATYIKARGMYTDAQREMIFLVVSRKEVHLVQHKIKDIDPKAFVVVTDAYDTYGEGFKPFPDKDALQAE